MTLIEWVFGIGAVVVGIGLATYFGGYKTSGLWIGFSGATIFLLALALQIQQWIWRSASPLAPPAFRIEWKIAIFDFNNEPTTTNGFVTRSQGVNGDTISPIKLAISLSVTNLQHVQSTLETYSLETSDDAQAWNKSSPAIWGADVFWIGGGLNRARQLNLRKCGFDLELLAHSVQPHDTIQGWIFFYDPQFALARFHRIKLKDAAGVESVLTLKQPLPRQDQVELQRTGLDVLPGVSDLSRVRIEIRK
jgi:hypothetical protein